MVSLAGDFGTLLLMRKCTTSLKMSLVAVLIILGLLFFLTIRQFNSNCICKTQSGALVAIILVRFSKRIRRQFPFLPNLKKPD